MEIEIYLEYTQADVDVQQVAARLRKWHAEGAEIRYDKLCFGGLIVLEEARRYRVDLGGVEPIIAIRELHAMLYRFGVKVFVHFSP